MFYSPFTDKKGKMQSINEISYSDLKQLKEKEIKEGYKVEFKASFDDSVKKKHLCKEISSFANSNGGWLFIGINDDGLICDIDIDNRTDYDVTITNLLKEKVTPIPNYELKILINPNNTNKCVLVLYIAASKNTPFVCNGTIYLRNGSSAIEAKRSDIDNLYQRKKEVINSTLDFCTHDYFETFTASFPYCYLYLFNPDSAQELKSFQLDELCNAERPDNINLTNRSTNSVIFYNSNTTAVTSFFEYFDDHNIKFGFPMIHYDKFEKQIPEYIKTQYGVDLNFFYPVDGYLTLENMSLLIKNAFEVLEHYERNIKPYSFIFEFKNVQNSYVLFGQQLKEQFDLFKNKGIRFCKKRNVRSRDITIKYLNNNGNKYGYALAIAATVMGNTFGYTFDEFIALFANSQEKYKQENGKLEGVIKR